MLETICSGVDIAATVSANSDVAVELSGSAAADCAVNPVNAASAFRDPIDTEVGILVVAEADAVLANSEAIDGEGGRKGRFPSSEGINAAPA